MTTEIDCPDMPADGAARYRVMVAETRRMTREVAAMAEKLRKMTARAEKAEAVCKAADVWDTAVKRDQGGGDEWPAVEQALDAWRAAQPQPEAQAGG